MTNIYTLLLMSISGTLMYFLSCIFGKHSRHHVWQYAMLVASVLILLVPIQKIFEIPKLFSITVPQSINISSFPTSPSITQKGVLTSITVSGIITILWFTGIFFFLSRIVLKYIKTSRELKQITEECYNDKVLNIYFNICNTLSVKKNIVIRQSKYIHSPLLFGILKPIIIIPDKQFSCKELEMILLHELTHYKHHDLWIALAASAAQCVHWFNPVVYFIGKSISEVCELFCDETVVKSLSSKDKKEYGKLILSVIEKELNQRLAYTTSMASAKYSIQKRLRKIIEFKTPTKVSVITGFIAVFTCMISSLTALGFEVAIDAVPEEIKQIIPNLSSSSIPTQTPFVSPIMEPADESPAPMAVTEIQPETDTQSSKKTSYENLDVYKNTSAEDISNLSEKTSYEYTKENNETVQTTDETEVYHDIFETENNSQTSYVFNADFADNGQSQSDNFSVTADTKLSISKINGSSDVHVSVHNAVTGEVIYDERTDKIHDNFSMTVPDDGEYYITAYSDSDSHTGIYVYGE